MEHSGIVIYGSNLQTNDDIDIVGESTGFIPMAISVKYKCSAVKAINQLIDYVISSQTALNLCIGKFSKHDDPTHTHFVGMNVHNEKGELQAIKDWILLPYRD